MEERIKRILEQKVNPALAGHYGGAALSKLEGGTVWIRFTGACGTCPSAQMTLEDTVKQIIMEECEGVEDVRLDTSVSEDLLDMARKLLNQGK